jgi:hypothetical protein
MSKSKLPPAMHATETVACLLISDFVIQFLRHQNPKRINAPVTLVQYDKFKAKVIAPSKEARRLGIRSGITIKHARALAPTGHFIPYGTTLLNEATQSLLVCLDLFTNRIEIEPSGFPEILVAYLDLGYVTEAERKLTFDSITQRLAQANYSGNIAFAADKLTAYAEVTNTTNEFSLEQVSDFVAEHYGRDDVFVHQDQSDTTLDYRPGVRVHQNPEATSISMGSESPLTTREEIDSFVDKFNLILAEYLDQRSASIQRFTLIIYFADGGPLTEYLKLLQPVSSAESLHNILQQVIDQQQLTQSITRFEVCLTELVPVGPRQLELFAENLAWQPLFNSLETLIERHGPCFYQIELADTESLLPEERFRAYRLIC